MTRVDSPKWYKWYRIQVPDWVLPKVSWPLHAVELHTRGCRHVWEWGIISNFRVSRHWEFEKLLFLVPQGGQLPIPLVPLQVKKIWFPRWVWVWPGNVRHILPPPLCPQDLCWSETGNWRLQSQGCVSCSCLICWFRHELFCCPRHSYFYFSLYTVEVPTKICVYILYVLLQLWITIG